MQLGSTRGSNMSKFTNSHLILENSHHFLSSIFRFIWHPCFSLAATFDADQNIFKYAIMYPQSKQHMDNAANRNFSTPAWSQWQLIVAWDVLEQLVRINNIIQYNFAACLSIMLLKKRHLLSFIDIWTVIVYPVPQNAMGVYWRTVES